VRRWVWLVVAIGLAIRVALIPSPGFPGDISTFQSWGLGFARFGPHELYADTSNLRWAAVDYPPAYMLVLGALGWIALHVTRATSGLGFTALIKAPAIAADIALAFVAYRIALRVVEPPRARIVFVTLLLAPPLWIVSGYWGQVDSVAVLVLLCALLAALSNRMLLAWLLLALTILIKPQSAPVALVLLVWETRTFGVRLRLLWSAALGALLAYLITIVFSPTLAPLGAFRWLFGRYLVGVNKYPNGSSGAFNVYTIAGSFWTSDARRVYGVTLHDLGNVAYIVLLGAVLARLWLSLSPLEDRRERERAVLSACFVALVGLFMVVTRMHERYLLPGLAIGALVALWSIEMAIVETVLATTFSINCALILAGFYGGSHHPVTLLLARAASLVNALAFTSLVLFYFFGDRLPWRTSSRSVALKNTRSSTTA
jgi:Gpi18-like mannosyltransferase